MNRKAEPLLPTLCGLCLAIVCGMLLAGCDDDKQHDYPSVVTELVLAVTDTEKTVTEIRTDDGHAYDVSAQSIEAASADTLLRCMAQYEVNGDKMKVYGIAQVFADKPVLADTLAVALGDSIAPGGVLPRDPVKLVSIWKSGGFVNLHLGVMTTGEAHGYAFAEDSVGCFSLVHIRLGDDQESYTRHLYMSMPIPMGLEKVKFSVMTYDGLFEREYTNQ